MRCRRAGVAGAVAWLLLACAAGRGIPQDLAADVRALETRRYEAMVAGDVSALEMILAEDYVHTHSDGTVEDRAEHLRRLGSGELDYQAIDVEEARVLVHGDTAVVVGLSALRVAFAGGTFEPRLRFTSVYTRSDDGWRLLAYESTRAKD